jgi:photosystem II stability/assembly factor-like uncharacterized protein
MLRPWLLFFPIFCCAACAKDALALRFLEQRGTPSTDVLTGVWFTDSLHGYACGGSPWVSGVLLSTRDGGASWRIDTSNDRKFECVRFAPDGQGYACGQDAVWFWPPDKGRWQMIGQYWAWHRACHFPDRMRGVIVSAGSFQGGRLRLQSPYFWASDTTFDISNALSDVWFSDSLTVHAVGMGWVTRSEDGGRSWRRVEIGGDFFTSVHFPDARTGYICGSSGTILKTTDGGLHWHSLRTGGSLGKRRQPFQAIWFDTPERGFVAGEGGLLWHSSDGGAHWTAVEGIPGDVDFWGLFGQNGRYWAAASGGRLFVFEP